MNNLVNENIKISSLPEKVCDVVLFGLVVVSIIAVALQTLPYVTLNLGADNFLYTPATVGINAAILIFFHMGCSALFWTVYTVKGMAVQRKGQFFDTVLASYGLVFCLTALIALLPDLSFLTRKFALTIIAGALGIVMVVAVFRQPKVFNIKVLKTQSPVQRFVVTALVIFSIILMVSIYSSGPIFIKGADQLDYLASSKRILWSDEFFLKDLGHPYGSTAVDLTSSQLQSLTAWLAQLSGSDVHSPYIAVGLYTVLLLMILLFKTFEKFASPLTAAMLVVSVLFWFYQLSDIRDFGFNRVQGYLLGGISFYFLFQFYTERSNIFLIYSLIAMTGLSTVHLPRFQALMLVFLVFITAILLPRLLKNPRSLIVPIICGVISVVAMLLLNYPKVAGILNIFASDMNIWAVPNYRDHEKVASILDIMNIAPLVLCLVAYWKWQDFLETERLILKIVLLTLITTGLINIGYYVLTGIHYRIFTEGYQFITPIMFALCVIFVFSIIRRFSFQKHDIFRLIIVTPMVLTLLANVDIFVGAFQNLGQTTKSSVRINADVGLIRENHAVIDFLAKHETPPSLVGSTETMRVLGGMEAINPIYYESFQQESDLGFLPRFQIATVLGAQSLSAALIATEDLKADYVVTSNMSKGDSSGVSQDGTIWNSMSQQGRKLTAFKTKHFNFYAVPKLTDLEQPDLKLSREPSTLMRFRFNAEDIESIHKISLINLTCENRKNKVFKFNDFGRPNTDPASFIYDLYKPRQIWGNETQIGRQLSPPKTYKRRQIMGTFPFRVGGICKRYNLSLISSVDMPLLVDAFVRGRWQPIEQLGLKASKTQQKFKINVDFTQETFPVMRDKLSDAPYLFPAIIKPKRYAAEITALSEPVWHNANHTYTNVLDKNNKNYAAAAASGPAELTLDLGENVSIDHIVLEQYHPEQAFTDYAVLVSEDLKSWITLYDASQDNNPRAYVFPGNITKYEASKLPPIRYFKLNYQSSKGQNRLLLRQIDFMVIPGVASVESDE